MSARTEALSASKLRRLNGCRWAITWVWLVGLTLGLTFVVYTDRVFYSGNEQFLGPNESVDRFRQPIDKLYKDVLLVYAAFLTPMLASGFAQKKTFSAEQDRHRLFFAALFISLGWNIFVIYKIGQMSFAHNLEIQVLSESLDSWAKDTTWLITPFLVYYFGSEHP
jgi:hypothetical protein